MIVAALVILVAIGARLACGDHKLDTSLNSKVMAPQDIGKPNVPISAVANLDRPTGVLTPGKVDPSVTQQNVALTICVHGYTATVRPRASYTGRLKRRQLADPHRGYSDTDPRDYEEDHLIPLELGGSPNDPNNLWPEHWADPQGARLKDRLENELHRRVCLAATDPDWLSLGDAQHEISTDWVQAYHRYISN